MTPDLSFLIGVVRGVHIIFAMYVSCVCIRVRGSYQVFFCHASAAYCFPRAPVS